ncbi:MAG TPA: type II toxin-antitoxin system VapC family toxin [Burkholderiaceae bacterium]|nr:type II toxin-antitoxin system VapC family toxin [Burkholderiaceae bacterium]
MIVDTSIVVALAAAEPSRDWIRRTLENHPRERLRMAWVNIAEAAMVLERASKGASAGLEAGLTALGVEPIEADYETIGAAIAARERFPLDFGDCFAYALARTRGEALITLDADFLATDLQVVLHPARMGSEPVNRL